MRVTVDGKEFKAAIAWGTKGVNRTLGDSASGALAILHFEGSTLTIKSSDGKRSFVAKANVSGLAADENAEVRIYGPDLVSAGNVLDNEPVTVEIKDSEVVFILPRSRFAVNRSAVRSRPMPELPSVVGTVTLQDLKKAAKHAASAAMSGDDLPIPALGAVLFEFSPEDSRLRLEATDRTRMVVLDVDYVPVDIDAEERKVLVPQAMVKTLLVGLPDTSTVEIHANETYFGISADKFSGFVSVEEVDPIPYQALYNYPTDKRLTVDRNSLKSAIGKVSSILSNGQNIHLNLEPGVIVISDPDGRQKVEADIMTEDLVEGETTTLKFNPAILTPALAGASTSVISFSFVEETKPVIIRETTNDGSDDMAYFSVVMPVR